MNNDKLKQIARDHFDVFFDMSAATSLGEAYLPLAPHQEFLCKKLEEYNEKVLLKQSPRYILCMPPRHSKTYISCINFPIWVLGNHPMRKMALVTYGATLSEKTGSAARDLATSDLVTGIFPDLSIRADTKSKTDWKIEKGGHYFSTTVSASLIGIGLTDLIIDDPYKDRAEAESATVQNSTWEWFKSTAQSRMEDGGGILIIMQRWNDNDLVQKLLDQEKELKEAGQPYRKWEVINLPAIIETEDDMKNDPLKRKMGDVLWQAKYPIEELNVIRSTSSPYYFASQYQQKPTSNEAQIFKKEYIQYYGEEMQYDRVYTSLDPAVSTKKDADKSAIVTVGIKDKKAYVIEVTSSQFNSNEVLTHLFRHQKMYNSDVLVETIASQKLWMKLINDKMIDNSQFFKVKEVRNLTNKETRIFSTLMPFFSEQRIYFRVTQQSLVSEILAYPRGRRDDEIDALTQALQNAEFKPQQQVRFVRPSSSNIRRLQPGWED